MSEQAYLVGIGGVHSVLRTSYALGIAYSSSLALAEEHT